MVMRMKGRFKERANNPTKDPRLQGMETKYGGRTLVFQVAINTEREINEIVEIIRKTVRGPKQDQIFIGCHLLEGDEAAEFWSGVYDTSENYVKKTGLS